MLVRFSARIQRTCQRLVTAVIVVAALVGVSARADAQSWTVDPSRSTIGFQGTQGGSVFNGRFNRFEADIRFDPQALSAAKVVVRVDMLSATADEPRRTEALPTPDWFEVSRYPAAVFETRGFRHLGGNRYEADAQLTIRDRQRSVMLPFTLDFVGDEARMRGETTLVRTEFGVGQGAWARGDVVALEVKVTVDLTARRAN